MAMAGLFWIAESDVYLGAKPAGHAPGIRLSPEGVVALGEEQAGFHPWEDVRDLTVTGVPLSSLKRRAGGALDWTVALVGSLFLAPTGPVGADEGPALMTVRLATSDGGHDLMTYAADSSYAESEVALSGDLLTRFTADPAAREDALAAMAEWGRTAEDGTPRAAERERLLKEWAAPLS